MKKRIFKKSGITLIESLIALSLISTIAIGGVKGYSEYQKYVSERAAAKDITTLLKAVDTRISIDGYSYNFWTSGSEAEGLSEIAPYVLETFIAKNNKICGKSNGWEPRLESEKERAFIDCNFWQTKLPLNSDLKIKTKEDSQGFIESFSIYLNPPVSKPKEISDYRERFEKISNIFNRLKSNDFANKNGINKYSLVDSSDKVLSNFECSTNKDNCLIKASWERAGAFQSLKTDGTNSMISSNISFIYDKINSDSIKTCLIWEEDLGGNWSSSPIECGIGLFSIKGTPVPSTVHVNIEDSFNSNEKIVLDKVCNIYSRDMGKGIEINGSSPCGQLQSAKPSHAKGRIVIQLVDRQFVNKMFVSENLFSESIENVDILNVALNLYNNLNNSEATLEDLNVSGEAVMKESVKMLKDLDVGEKTTSVTKDMLKISTLDSYGTLFRVKENAYISNALLEPEKDIYGNLAYENINIEVLAAFMSDPIDDIVFEAKAFKSDLNIKIGDSCEFAGENEKNLARKITVGKEGVVLTCRTSHTDQTKYTWQSNNYGEIMAFNGTCPTGWKQVEDVHSRFLMGSGKYKEAFMSELLYKVGDKGGETFVGLTEEQMAEHHHATPKFEHICDTCHRGVPQEDCPPPFTWYAYENRCVNSQGMSHTKDGSSVFSNDSERISTYVGGNKSHNNMPNYETVTYCMYGKGDKETEGDSTLKPQEPKWVPYESIYSGWLDDDFKKFYSCGTSIREYSPEENLYYSKRECKLDQYKEEYVRERDINSGNIRETGEVRLEYRTIEETQIWKSQPFEYTEWVETGSFYECTEETMYYDSAQDDYYMRKYCKLDLERTGTWYEIDIRFGDKRLIPESVLQFGETPNNKNPFKEYKTEIREVKRKVAAAGFDPDKIKPEDLEIVEGDYGTTSQFKIKIKLNKPFEEDVTYRVNTQDITTTSILSETENLVYDEYGNPFISIVDNPNGGRLMFDGGFPKYYNNQWNGATKFNELQDQFIFMHNVIKWISNTHKSRGKVLIYGDAIEGHSYSVHENAGSDFDTSIPSVISIAGFTPIIKEASHPDFNGSKSANRKVNLTLEEMNKYSAIVVMSSGGWDSLTNESANNFTTYINNGGGVYIITDHSYFQRTGNQILRKFGSEFYGTVNRHTGNDAYKLQTIWNSLSSSKYGRNHELWNGMSSNDYIHAGWSEGNVRLFTPIQDYIGTSKDLTFIAGEIEKEISVTINGDDLAEADETFKIVLSNPESGVVIGNSELIVTIIDDDSGVKSLSSSCGADIRNISGTCLKVTNTAFSVDLVEDSNKSEKMKGDIKIRHSDTGDTVVELNLGGFKFKEICEDKNYLDLIKENSKTIVEGVDYQKETEISNMRILSKSKWKSSKTLKEEYVSKNSNCDLLKDYDYNISIEADVSNIEYSKVDTCTGVVKDGYCQITETYKAELRCLGDYHESAGYCFKN